MSWADVVGKLFAFLEKPTGLGAFCLVLAFLFLLYLAPVAALTWINYDGTNRVVAEIRELRTSLGNKIAYKE